MPIFTIKIFALVFALALFSPHVSAQNESTAPSSGGTFGNFEVGIPGKPELAAGQSIDSFASQGEPILSFISTAVNVVVALVVIIGVISIVVGGYIYMTAGGNGDQVKQAKVVIKSALFGIIIALTSVVILNTINRFLGSDAIEPQLGNTQGGTAGGGAPASSNTGAGNNSPGGTLPNSNPAPTDNGSDAEPEAPDANPPNPLPNPSDNTPTTGTPTGTGAQSVSVTIQESKYYINGQEVTLEEVVSLAQNATGEPTTGLRVHYYQVASSRAGTENTMFRALNDAGIPNTDILQHDYQPPQP